MHYFNNVSAVVMRCLYLCSSSSSESLHLNWHSSQQYSIMSASWRLQLSWGVRTIGKPRPRLSFEVLFIKESLCYGFQGRVNIKMVETPGHRAPPPPRWGPRTPSAGTRGAWCGGRGRTRGWRWSRGCPSLACSHPHHRLLEMRTTYNIMLDNRSERWRADCWPLFLVSVLHVIRCTRLHGHRWASGPGSELPSSGVPSQHLMLRHPRDRVKEDFQDFNACSN